MTTTLLRSEPTTCATCPLAQHLDRDRYQCSATHNHYNPVVRGHWQATADCYRVLERLSGWYSDDWLTEPIGSNPDSIFGSFIEPSDEEIATFPIAENAYHDPNFDVMGGEF
ncbi:MAG: hypothetical protein F6K14_11635 [Symploca sp. SIO2C1]|nr:hypothetical protein [Symploca sp. SIO2C1]